MKPFLSIIFLLSNICCVWSYSSGAPKSISVCSRQLPHHGVKPQDGEAPYVIKVNTTSPGYGDFIQGRYTLIYEVNNDAYILSRSKR